jgi:pimeloyl-ACP methyl ester carboxylesterase
VIAPSPVLLDGPWEHRSIGARGARFHVAENGSGPLVVFLHGFPQFWWSWRNQLSSFAAAGYRAVAMDLRGYGASDHTPRGYDIPSLARDVDAVIQSLGAADAIVVAHDWGGFVGWTLAARHPKSVRRLVTVGSPHPLRLRAALLRHPAQLNRSAHALSMQAPWLPERRFTKGNAAKVDQLLHQWSAPGWPDVPTAMTYRRAFQSGNTAYCAAEYHRWLVRSAPRIDGLRYARQMKRAITVPVLQVHGARDRCFLPEVAQGSGRYVDAPYRWRLLDGVGHFPHEEDPERFDRTVLSWLADPEPDR